MKLTISISPKKTARVLAIVVLCLTLLSVAGQFAHYILGFERTVAVLNVDAEQSIPTWYSSFTLLLCSLLLAAIAFSKKVAGKHYVRHWSGLSLIFLYLSIDEAVALHERLIEPLRAAFNTSGVLHFAWVIPGIAFVLIVLLAYLRFLLHLPAKTRYLFILAGSLYIGGALGTELIGGYYVALYGEQNLIYALITTFEEFFEMMGIVVFIYTLLSYMSSHAVKQVMINIGIVSPKKLSECTSDSG